MAIATCPLPRRRGWSRASSNCVAPRYDLMNDLMSGGVHRLWKNALVDVLHPRTGEKFLDVAGGTGDIAFRIARGAQGERPDVTICDINPAMLEVGRDRAVDRGLLQAASPGRPAMPRACRSPTARSTPIRSPSACATSPTSTRRWARRSACCGRAGASYCLEFSKVTSAPVGRVYDAYSERALPLLGRVIARDAESYRYLHESIRRFPSQRDLARAHGRGGLRAASAGAT